MDPGLKFAGQWLDEESGLFYNRFWYYSPLAGCYLTPDPIGIQGGENTYGYVPNPTGEIDPLGLAKKKPKEDPRKPAPEVPKVKEETYKIVRHVSPEELENIKKAGGKIVLHHESPRVARWINVPSEQHGYGTVNPKPQVNIHRITYTVTERGIGMLDKKIGIDFEKFDKGEEGAPDKVFYKQNEKGARGIGVNVLKDFNKEIIGAQYETRIGKTKEYSKPKPIIECKGNKKGR
nr:RHS repeat-associated core domain-containing protein [Xenorhabdus bovienii]